MTSTLAVINADFLIAFATLSEPSSVGGILQAASNVAITLVLVLVIVEGTGHAHASRIGHAQSLIISKGLR